MQAEADLKTFQECKAREGKSLREKKDFESLDTYMPWGKPAGGAPKVTSSGRVDARRRGLRFDELPSNVLAYNPFGRPGCGAPHVTQTGTIESVMTRDPDLRFQDHLRKEVEISMRYQPAGSKVGCPLQEPKQEVSGHIMSLPGKERKRQLYHAEVLEKQRQEEQKKSLSEGKENDCPSTFFCGVRTNLDRDMSGKLQPHRRALDAPADAGMTRYAGCQDKYISMAAKMSQKLPHPSRKGGEGDSYPLKMTNLLSQDQPRLMRTNFARRKPNEQVHVDKSKEGCGEGLDVATWIRTGVVGMPKKNQATGHVIGGARQCTDLIMPLDKGTCGQSRPNYQQYSIELQHQVDTRQRERKEDRKEQVEQELLHIPKADAMWERKEIEGNKGTSMDWLGQVLDKDMVRTKQMQYRRELEQQVNDKDAEQKREMEREKLNSRKYMNVFGKEWGQPVAGGAGAPRLGPDRKINTTRTHKGSLGTAGYHSHGPGL